MKKIPIFFICLMLCACSFFEGTDKQRYVIYTTQLEERKDDVNTITILLDSESGKSWYLTSGLYWHPLTVLNKLPPLFDKEAYEQGKTYGPDEQGFFDAAS
jgi:hypothetical protein